LFASQSRNNTERAHPMLILFQTDVQQHYLMKEAIFDVQNDLSDKLLVFWKFARSDTREGGAVQTEVARLWRPRCDQSADRMLA
jgi:hypothetical protein